MLDRVETLDSGILEIRLLVGLIDSGRLGTDSSSDSPSQPLAPGCDGESCKQSNFSVE